MATQPVKIWDWPVRLTHWSFVVLVPAMYFTAENSAWGWHKRLGVVLLGLLIFRILWGFVGTDTARFARFVKGPGKVIAYLRGNYDPKREIGHSPLGALAVLALLGVMLVQVVLGLFAGNIYDGATGPLNPLVGIGTADWMTDTHEWFYWVVFGMIGLHLAAIAFYGAKLQNLIGPMVGGKAEKAPEVADNSDPSLAALIGAIAASAGIAVWVYSGAPPLT